MNLSKNIRPYKGKSLVEIPDSFVVFDIETTGLNTTYNDIIEIGAIKVIDNKIVDTFHTLIKPRNKISYFITNLTGITNEMVKDAPSSKETLIDFLNYIGTLTLVGHNVNFDINFVYDKLIENNLPFLSNNYVDTLRLSRKLLKDLRNHKLGDLALYYSINYEGAHRGLKDAEITLKVLEKLREEIMMQYNTTENFKNSFHSKE